MFTKIRIESFACFSQFSWDSHGMLNVLVGANDTGKTLLMKMLYTVAKSLAELQTISEVQKRPWREFLSKKLYWVFQPGGDKLGELVRKGQSKLQIEADLSERIYRFAFGKDTIAKISDCVDATNGISHPNAIFLPPKEVLTAFDAIAATREKLLLFGFDDTYYDLIQALRLPPPGGQFLANRDRY